MEITGKEMGIMFEQENAGRIVGKNIKKARQKAGMSQQALALQVGCADASLISRFETGQRVPNLDLLDSIATALHTNVSALCDSNYSTSDIPQISELMEKQLSELGEIRHEIHAVRSEIEKIRTIVSMIESMLGKPRTTNQ